MYKSSKQTLDLDDAGTVAQLRKHGVQENALQTGRMFEQALAPFDMGELGAKRRPQPEPSLYLNSPVDGHCGVCGIGNVGGPGMESCEYAESCDGFEPPPGYEGLAE
jgi:hypothetical protein